jgi:hypothetical protein
MHCLEYDQFDCAKPKAPLAAVGLKQDSLPVLLSSGGGKGGRQRVGLTRDGIWLGLPTMYCFDFQILLERIETPETVMECKKFANGSCSKTSARKNALLLV